MRVIHTPLLLGMSSFRYSFQASPLLVVVHQNGDPDPQVWASYLQTLSSNPPEVALVWWSDWAPDPQHRADITRYAPSKIPVAVVSSEEKLEGVLGALSLFIHGMKQFHPEEMRSAFKFLGVGKNFRPIVDEAMRDAGWPGV